jgi:hypothetical protein
LQNIGVANSDLPQSRVLCLITAIGAKANTKNKAGDDDQSISDTVTGSAASHTALPGYLQSPHYTG